MTAVLVIASGMVCSVGRTAPAACAAIRARLARFTETGFMFGGEYLRGGAVALASPLRGVAKIALFLSSAVRECLDAMPAMHPGRIALLVAVAERGRPGRFDGLDGSLVGRVEAEIGVRFHAASQVFESGKVGGIDALDAARTLMARGQDAPQCCVVAGADTLLVGATLERYAADRRLLGPSPDGMVPGEGGAAVLVTPVERGEDGAALRCDGLGIGLEPAALDPDRPLRGDGITAALRAAMADAGYGWEGVDYRIADVNGEQRGFREVSLGMQRTLRLRKPTHPLWYPAGSTGDLGAATLPCLLAVAAAAAAKRYAPGSGVLVHVAGEDGRRGAVLARATRPEDGG